MQKIEIFKDSPPQICWLLLLDFACFHNLYLCLWVNFPHQITFAEFACFQHYFVFLLFQKQTNYWLTLLSFRILMFIGFQSFLIAFNDESNQIMHANYEEIKLILHWKQAFQCRFILNNFFKTSYLLDMIVECSDLVPIYRVPRVIQKQAEIKLKSHWKQAFQWNQAESMQNLENSPK